MKRAVKLKRREMKREIKRLKEEIKTLTKCDFAAKDKKDINVISFATIISNFMIINEETIEYSKMHLAHKIGEYILKSGFCAVTESDGLLGHEIRISCEIVK